MMPIDRIHLRKLLQLFDADARLQTALLRADIREEIAKKAGANSAGGDFYAPFWADAKRHVGGDDDLRATTESRIDANRRRDRLYPALQDGFLDWWENKRRSRNEPFKVIPENLHGRFPLLDGGYIKVEGTLAFTVGEEGHRVVYPYFSELPAMSLSTARIGLWVMSQTIAKYRTEDMRILDVIRGRTFSTLDAPLSGNERDDFDLRYHALKKRRDALKREYE